MTIMPLYVGIGIFKEKANWSDWMINQPDFTQFQWSKPGRAGYSKFHKTDREAALPTQ